MRVTLYYVADPMCSWCFGFQPQLEIIRRATAASHELRYVMGGLAPDNDEPMPADTVAYVQNAWREVEATTGVMFNWDFWTKCKPRRSTYPACRAVLAAAAQSPSAGPSMFAAIQRAYYTEARNPADRDVLIALAAELDVPLDVERFVVDLGSEPIARALQSDFDRRRKMGANSFPSLVVRAGGGFRLVAQGFARAADVVARLAGHDKEE